MVTGSIWLQTLEESRRWTADNGWAERSHAVSRKESRDHLHGIFRPRLGREVNASRPVHLEIDQPRQDPAIRDDVGSDRGRARADRRDAIANDLHGRVRQLMSVCEDSSVDGQRSI